MWFYVPDDNNVDDDGFLEGVGTGIAEMTALKYILLAFLIGPAILVMAFVGRANIFAKAGYKKWYAYIPGYSEYILCRIVWGDSFYGLVQLGLYFLGCIRLLGIGYIFGSLWLLMCAATNIKLAQVYGKSTLFGLGIVFLYPFFIFKLGREGAYDKSKIAEGLKLPKIRYSSRKRN